LRAINNCEAGGVLKLLKPVPLTFLLRFGFLYVKVLLLAGCDFCDIFVSRRDNLEDKPVHLTEKTNQRSLYALDGLNFFLADVRGGVGPFLVIYLLAVLHWNPAKIGVVMSVMELPISLQTPHVEHCRCRQKEAPPDRCRRLVNGC